MGRCQNNSGKIKTQRRKESYMGMGERNETGRELPGHGVEGQFGNQGA